MTSQTILDIEPIESFNGRVQDECIKAKRKITMQMVAERLGLLTSKIRSLMDNEEQIPDSIIEEHNNLLQEFKKMNAYKEIADSVKHLT